MGENDALQTRLRSLGEAVELALNGLERLPAEPLPVAAASLIAVEFGQAVTQVEAELAEYASEDPFGTVDQVARGLRRARESLAAAGFDQQVAQDRFVELLGDLHSHRQVTLSRSSLAAPARQAIPEQFARPVTGGGSRHRAPDSQAV